MIPVAKHVIPLFYPREISAAWKRTFALFIASEISVKTDFLDKSATPHR
jgi:hypothetical protein